MSFEEIAALLYRVTEIATQALQALQQAAEDADDCTRLVADATAGTTQEYEAADVVANFDAARAGADQCRNTLAAAIANVERIKAAFQTQPTTGLSWSEHQRARLPTYITSGTYLDPDGHTELVQSGREPDGEHERINAHLVAVGAIPPIKIEATTHVEMKVAWRMRLGNVDRVDLVINNKVCTGRRSCTGLLPAVLLPGQTLVIHDPVGSREIHGRTIGELHP
ncbi:DddA-like double-stranded DNA deaminase toxin [Lentzea sp. NPDC054927]